MKHMRVPQLLIVGLLALYSCEQPAEKQTGSEAQPAKVDEGETEAMKAKRLEQAFGRFKELYAELLDMKDEASFRQYGFGAGGPHASWLESVRAFDKDADSKLLIEKGFVLGELESLGMEYVASKGKETSLTEKRNTVFKRAIDPVAIETVVNDSGAQNYAKLQAESALFGKWKVTNSFAKQSYLFEIYKRGNEYIGVYPSREFKTEQLQKKGKDFYVKGSRNGEFYRIEANMTMALFDQDGELASSGWSAVVK